jgi:hypothetical protein
VKCEARYLKDNWDTMQESEGKWLEWLLIWIKRRYNNQNGNAQQSETCTRKCKVEGKNLQITGLARINVTWFSEQMKNMTKT